MRGPCIGLVLAGLVACGDLTEDGPVEVIRVEEGFQPGEPGDCATPDALLVEPGAPVDPLLDAIGEPASPGLTPADGEALLAVWLGGCPDTSVHLDPLDVRMDGGVLRVELSRRTDTASADLEGGPWTVFVLPDIRARRVDVELFTPRGSRESP